MIGRGGRQGLLNGGLDMFGEAVPEQGFQQHVLDTGCGGPGRDVLVGIAGDENHGGGDVVAPQQRNKIEAVHVRHLVVDDQAVETGRRGRAQQRRAASKGSNLETVGFQQEAQRSKKRRPLDKIVKELGDEIGIEATELKSADRSWAVSKARTMIAYVLVRRQGYALGEVARYFARDAATVGTLIGRLAERIAEDEMLQREIDRLNKKV